MSADLIALNERAAGLLLDLLGEETNRPVLLCDAAWSVRPKPHLAVWERRGTATDFTVWERNYAAILLGLPRAREELLMNLHCAAARLQPDAPLVLFGLKDAGIMAAAKLLPELFASVTLMLTKYHGRVFIARQPYADKLQSKLENWQRKQTIALPGHAVSLLSYPGMFAAGGLDTASALLIAQLSQLPAPKTVLDYACGTGVLALAARQSWPEARLHLLDHDALAIRAAQDNVPDADYTQAKTLAACSARYDLILSNPPIHNGTLQDYTVVEQLVRESPNHLARGGKLVLVTQQTVPVQHWAKKTTVLAQENGFRVWAVAA